MKKLVLSLLGLAALTAAVAQAQTTGTWNVDNASVNNWSTVGSWTGLTGGLVPNAIDAAVTLGPVITASRTVTLDTNVTIGSLTFNEDTVGANAYGVSFNNAARTMTFDVTTGNASILARGSGGYNLGTQGSGQIILNDNLAISAGSNNSAGSPGATVMLSSQITGNGTLILSSLSSNDGTGTATSNSRGTGLRSTVANTFSGGVTVNSGFVLVNGNIGNLGSGNLTLNSNAGGSSSKLQLQTGGGTLANNIVFGNGGGNSGFGIDVLDANTYTLGTLSGTTANNPLQFNSNSQGTLKLSGNSASLTAGQFYVRRGTLILDNANAWGTANTNASGWQVGNFSNGSTGSAELLTNGFNVGGNIITNQSTTAANTNSDNLVIGGNHTSGTATFSGNITAGRIVGGTRQLQLTSATGGTTVFSGLISDAAVSGSAATVLPVFKVGGGTVTLSNATGNTYTGNTTVSLGTLLVSNTSGSATGTGNLSVSLGAILGGSGIVTPGAGNSISVSGSIAPGVGGIGTLTFNGTTATSAVATFNTGATFSFDINATSVTSDKIALTNGASGDFVFNNNVINLSLTGLLVNGQSYILFDGTNDNQFTGLTIGALNKITSGLSYSGLVGDFTNSYLTLSGGDIVFNAVPEPSTWALLALSLTTVMVLRRRRRA